jgi:hypothetical protein
MSSDIDVHVFAIECAPVDPADFVGALLATGFSPDAYRDAYGDLRERGMSATEALGHYLRHGIHERRQAPLKLNGPALTDLAGLPIRNAEFKAQLLTSLLGGLFKDGGHPYGPRLVEFWPFLRDLTRNGAAPYFITGDSHSSNHAVTGSRSGDWLLPMHMICHGGSARGLGNPASRSGYGEHLRQAVRIIDSLAGADELPFLMQFGQVDIEFVHHFQRVRDSKTALDLREYQEFCATTIERYIRFVTDLFAPIRRSNVSLISVFPPAMSDDAWRQGHLNDDIVRRETDMPYEQLAAGIRALEIAGLRQRTDIHAYCTELLRSACLQHGFRFVDSYTPFLGPDGVVDQRYIIPEGHGFEHHLDSRRTYGIVADLVWDTMAVTGSRGRP